MDSQFVSILIGIGFVVGMPLLEKLIDKIKQGKHHGVNSVPPRRQASQSLQTESRPRHEEKAKAPVLTGLEGARVTADTEFSPYRIKNQYYPETAMTDQPQITTSGLDDLKKAVIWSEILNTPKFKEF